MHEAITRRDGYQYMPTLHGCACLYVKGWLNEMWFGLGRVVLDKRVTFFPTGNTTDICVVMVGYFHSGFLSPRLVGTVGTRHDAMGSFSTWALSMFLTWTQNLLHSTQVLWPLSYPLNTITPQQWWIHPGAITKLSWEKTRMHGSQEGKGNTNVSIISHDFDYSLDHFWWRHEVFWLSWSELYPEHGHGPGGVTGCYAPEKIWYSQSASCPGTIHVSR